MLKEFQGSSALPMNTNSTEMPNWNVRIILGNTEKRLLSAAWDYSEDR